MIRRRRHIKRPPGLMLTSLLDMFTIILIFLIVSFEAESHDFKLASDIELPESTAQQKLKPAVSVVVTSDGVTVSDRLVVPFTGGKPSQQALDNASLPALVEVLEIEYKKQADDAARNAPNGKGEKDEEDGAMLVIQSDKHLDYETLYTVLRSAAEAGFFKYRLAILKS